MSFDVTDVLTALQALEAAVSISTPVALTMKTTYRTVPSGKTMPETPCTLHLARPVRVQHVAGARSQLWQIRTQLFVYDVDQNQAGDIVLKFASALLNAISAHITFSGQPMFVTDWSSQSDIPARLEYAGKFYLGADFVASVSVPLEAVTVGA